MLLFFRILFSAYLNLSSYLSLFTMACEFFTVGPKNKIPAILQLGCQAWSFWILTCMWTHSRCLCLQDKQFISTGIVQWIAGKCVGIPNLIMKFTNARGLEAFQTNLWPLDIGQLGPYGITNLVIMMHLMLLIYLWFDILSYVNSYLEAWSHCW